MFIKYDEYELLELFQSEPISITDNPEAGELIYSYKDNQNFKVILTLDVYKQMVSISITFNDCIVFTGDFTGVTSIKKIDNDMVINVNEEKKIKVKFSRQLGVELV